MRRTRYISSVLGLLGLACVAAQPAWSASWIARLSERPTARPRWVERVVRQVPAVSRAAGESVWRRSVATAQLRLKTQQQLSWAMQDMAAQQEQAVFQQQISDVGSWTPPDRRHADDPAAVAAAPARQPEIIDVSVPAPLSPTVQNGPTATVVLPMPVVVASASDTAPRGEDTTARPRALAVAPALPASAALPAAPRTATHFDAGVRAPIAAAPAAVVAGHPHAALELPPMPEIETPAVDDDAAEALAASDTDTVAETSRRPTPIAARTTQTPPAARDAAPIMPVAVAPLATPVSVVAMRPPTALGSGSPDATAVATRTGTTTNAVPTRPTTTGANTSGTAVAPRPITPTTASETSSTATTRPTATVETARPIAPTSPESGSLRPGSATTTATSPTATSGRPTTITTAPTRPTGTVILPAPTASDAGTAALPTRPTTTRPTTSDTPPAIAPRQESDAPAPTEMPSTPPTTAIAGAEPALTMPYPCTLMTVVRAEAPIAIWGCGTADGGVLVWRDNADRVAQCRLDAAPRLLEVPSPTSLPVGMSIDSLVVVSNIPMLIESASRMLTMQLERAGRVHELTERPDDACTEVLRAHSMGDEDRRSAAVLQAAQLARDERAAQIENGLRTVRNGTLLDLRVANPRWIDRVARRIVSLPCPDTHPRSTALEPLGAGDDTQYWQLCAGVRGSLIQVYREQDLATIPAGR